MRLSPAQVAGPPAVDREPGPEVDAPNLPASYLELYGLAKPPFGMAADPAPFLLFDSQRGIFESLVTGLRQGRGHLLLIGEAGVGKSSLLDAALDTLPEKARGVFRVSRLRPGPLTRQRLIAQILQIAESEAVTPKLLSKARTAVAPRPGNSKPALLVIDDAQYLTEDALEWLLRIAGGRSADMPQVLLVGRPDIQTMLAHEHGKPFCDRIARALQLGPLKSIEMQQYIERRLWLAGSSTRRLMNRPAMRIAIRRAAGRPGVVESLMEGALGAGFLRREQYLTARTIRSAAGRRPVSRRQPPDLGRIILIVAPIVLALGIAAFTYRALVGS
jgi:general secretion pathway protein A